MQPLVAPLLVALEMAGGVECDGLPRAPVGVDPERRLLGHRARQEEERRFLAEDSGDLGLELLDDATGAVVVDRRLRRDRPEQIFCLAAPGPVDEALATVGYPLKLGVSRERRRRALRRSRARRSLPRWHEREP